MKYSASSLYTFWNFLTMFNLFDRLKVTTEKRPREKGRYHLQIQTWLTFIVLIVDDIHPFVVVLVFSAIFIFYNENISMLCWGSPVWK